MIPRLRAQGILDQMAAVALGSGSLKKMDAQRLLRDLERQAAGDRSKKVQPDAAMLAAIGIEVVEK